MIRAPKASVLFVMVTTLGGCATWQPVALYHRPDVDRLRVTTTSGEVMELRSVRIEGDSALIGISEDLEPHYIPLREIASTEKRVDNPGVWVGSFALGAIVFWMIDVLDGASSGPRCPRCAP